MISFSKETVAELCKKYGDLLHVPGLDGKQLLWAIAGNESSFGHDCGPRFEVSYFEGGANSRSLVMQNLLAKYGHAAACSYGPWQLMLVNCAGSDPDSLNQSAEQCCLATVRYLNGYVFGHWNCKTLEEIGECFNGGHPGAHVPEYVERLKAHYEVPIP